MSANDLFHIKSKSVTTTLSVESLRFSQIYFLAICLFYSITSKFKGKVILVDFWATWCGPCKMAMKQMKPMKKDLEGKDIVYVFIAGENSPKETWDNMIPDIHGEHYRVTAAQWNYLSKQFSIQGVPTYIIVDKEGGIIQKYTGFPGVDTVKKELMKALEK